MTRQISAATTPTVVLIDDDTAVRSALSFMLELDGFNVVTYASTEEALDEGIPFGATCIVTDLSLPGEDGLTLLAALRAQGITLPAILITSHPNLAVRGRAAKAGVPIVEKPLLGDQLLAAIHQACVPLQ